MSNRSDADAVVTLEFQIDSRETLREALLDSAADDTLFMRGTFDLEIGEGVQIRCVAREFTLFLEGVVLWRRQRDHDAQSPAGIGVRVSPECGGRFSFLRSWTLQPLDRPERVAERHPSAKVALLVVGGRSVEAKLVNVSETGACAEVPEPLMPEDSVTLQLASPTPHAWSARVAWSAGGKGGLSLRFDDLEAVRAWQAFVLEARASAPAAGVVQRVVVKRNSGNVPLALRASTRTKATPPKPGSRSTVAVAPPPGGGPTVRS